MTFFDFVIFGFKLTVVHCLTTMVIQCHIPHFRELEKRACNKIEFLSSPLALGLVLRNPQMPLPMGKIRYRNRNMFQPANEATVEVDLS